MIGFPGEDPASWDRIVEYAKEIQCDYFALNAAEVRLGTTLDHNPPASELVREHLFFDEDVLGNAVKRLNRKFYLRPSFILNQLGNIQSPSHLLRLATLGIQMLNSRRS